MSTGVKQYDQQQQYASVYGGRSSPSSQQYPSTQPSSQQNRSQYNAGSSRARTARYAATTDKPANPNRNRNIAACAATCVLLGILGFLTWKYALDEPSNWSETGEGFGDLWEGIGNKWNEWDLGNFSDVLDGLDDISFGDLFNEDPQSGKNVTLKWHEDFIKYDDGGLHLTLRNALDDTWQTEFEYAVADWSESEALTLDTERVDVDHTCKRVDDVMLVCNANFGATGWVGINENSIMGANPGVIVSSIAKMNEYYLRNANFDHRRFTMCHEIGHGLGLPHTDENPYNSNLGNCLDYTDNPKTNILPGEVNMAKLRNMYLDRRRTLSRVEKEDGTVVVTTATMVSDEMREEWAKGSMGGD